MKRDSALICPRGKTSSFVGTIRAYVSSLNVRCKLKTAIIADRVELYVDQNLGDY